MYAEAGLANFDEDDLQETLASINSEVSKLPQSHSDLWDLFKEVKTSHDEEAFEMLLAEQAARDEFYARLAEYTYALGIALSSEQFIMSTPENKLRQYKEDLKRFQNLKKSVKLRYAEEITYKDYEPKIKKLLDTHIQAHEVIQINEPVNIFDEKTFSIVKEGRGIYEAKSTGSKADTIAHATKKVITERMEEDPALYEKFSKLIQQAIDDFRAKRITDLEYLNHVMVIRDKVIKRERDYVPKKLSDNEDAQAFYGVLEPFFNNQLLEKADMEDVCADAAIAVHSILKKNWKVNFWDDADAQKRAINEIDDYLYDEIKGRKGVELSLEQMDGIIERSMQLARHRTLA